MGLIVVFGFALAVALATYSGAGSRLKRLEDLARMQGWRVEKTYTNAARGYVVARVQDLVATISLADEKHIGSTVRVELPSPGAPIFDIRPSALTALVGNRVELAPGLAAYTPEPDDTRALFTPARLQALRTLLADAEVRCDRDAIIIVQPPRLPLGTIPAAVAFAVDLATAERYGLDALRAIPGAVYRPTTSERAACVEVDGPSPIRFTAVRESDHVTTRASIEQGRMPSPVPDLSELGPVTLAGDASGGITLTWPFIERDPKRLAAAVDLLRELAGGPRDGAYR
ncbi:MAG: hypothetical protein JO257_19925 [Deltaproteobacteria bacterium]|nr:hypothetical protein [Deltaproteobacteria bacterium]